MEPLFLRKSIVKKYVISRKLLLDEFGWYYLDIFIKITTVLIISG